MKNVFGIVIILFSVLSLSCNSDYPGFSQTDSGLYYKFHIENDDAPLPQEGDVLTVSMIYRSKDSILFNSSTLPEAFRFPLDPSGFEGDIFEGLAMMHIGDSATFIIPADSLKRYGNLPPLDTGTMLFFDIKLISIQPKAEFDKEQELLKRQQDQALEKMKLIENEDIAKYIKDNKIGTKPSESGLYFIIKKNGVGSKAIAGKVVEIHYSAEFLNGKKLFSSHEESGESICFELGKGFEIPAIEEALIKMNAGCVAKLVVPSSIAYGEKGIEGLVPSYSPLIFELELISIMQPEVYRTKMEKTEKESILKYLKESNITASPKESGLYFIETKKGIGAMAVLGKTVKINYTGKFLNGKLFDSSEESGPVEFQMGAGQVIPAWEIAVAYLNVGGKAKLIVPSKLAYGDAYAGTIPPYTPLVYEIELLSVR